MGWAAPRVIEGLTLEITPAHVERRTFDPKAPPAEMPALRPPEVGQCVYRFSCDMETRVTRTASAKPPTRAVVHGVKIVTRLEVVLWTPRGGDAAIGEHEEAHREICEYYYGHARAIAADIGRRMVGQSIPLRATGPEDVREAVRRFQQSFISEYMRQTMDRCTVAQEHFDRITDHSRRRVAIDAAIVQAIAAESEARAPKPGQPVRAAPRRPSMVN